MDVLIAGASMAGLSAAYWFARLGHRTTVVERAEGLRPGGAPIDVRGKALGTAERMGIPARIEAEKVSIVEPMPVLDGTGQQVASLDLRWFANETDHDVEITRDRLNRILHSVVPDRRPQCAVQRSAASVRWAVLDGQFRSLSPRENRAVSDRSVGTADVARDPFAATKSPMQSLNEIGGPVGCEGCSNVCSPWHGAGARAPGRPMSEGFRDAAKRH